MNYRLDAEAFDKWHNEVSRYPMLLEFDLCAAKFAFESAFKKKLPPVYRMVASNTKTGKEETFPPDFDFSKVVPF